jgi:hypothetical protein
VGLVKKITILIKNNETSNSVSISLSDRRIIRQQSASPIPSDIANDTAFRGKSGSVGIVSGWSSVGSVPLGAVSDINLSWLPRIVGSGT